MAQVINKDHGEDVFSEEDEDVSIYVLQIN